MLARLMVEAKPVELAIAEEQRLGPAYLRIDVTTKQVLTRKPEAMPQRATTEGGTVIAKPWYRRVAAVFGA